MKREDGGPAFPTIDYTDHKPELGMSLRDYFAGKALSYLVSDNILIASYTEHETALAFTNAAAFAYRCADAMLIERLKP